ncbi:MAG: galactose oxidase-like domain-containing protein [Lautropia sp.]
MSYGTSLSSTGYGQFKYDVWDPTEPLGSPGSHLTLDNTTGTYIFCSALILTPGGDLLINGGDLLQNGTPTSRGIADVNVFNPLNNSLTRAGSMQRGRWYGTNTVLPNGEIYIQGGTDGEDHPEIRGLDGQYRLLNGIATDAVVPGSGGSRYFDNNYPRNFVGPNGKIWGFDPHYLYEVDPYGNGGTGSIRMFGAQWDIPNTRGGNSYRGWASTSSAVLMRPGKILQLGGAQNNATLIDINGATPVVTDLPPMPQQRQWLSATVLPDGKVFSSGGSVKNLLSDPAAQDAGTIWYSTLMFDPDAQTWTTTASLSVPRLYHSLTLLLPDATVLSTGGGEPGPVNNLNAQVFSPGYLFDDNGNLAPRPVIDPSNGGLPQVLAPSATINMTSASAADIARVTLVKTGAVTHSFDMEQRFIELPFNRVGQQINATLPANPYLTPPGYYMVFIINQQGVPSKAKMIRINPVT